MSTPDVLLRALLVVAFAGVALFSVRADHRHGWPSEVSHPQHLTVRPNPLEHTPDVRRRLVAVAGLTGGAIVAGAMLAVVVSVIVAYLVTSISGLLS